MAFAFQYSKGEKKCLCEIKLAPASQRLRQNFAQGYFEIPWGGINYVLILFLERIPGDQYFLIFRRPDVFITYFSNRGYLQSV